MIHELPFEQRTLHGRFSRELPPAVTIDPGDSVRFTTPNAGWELAGPHDVFVSSDPSLDTGHALAGPIEVRGARAGQTLAVRIDEVRPGSWGVTPTSEDHAIVWELDDHVGRGGGFEVDLAPFLGVIGMPPDEPGPHPTAPPRPSGGNLDCKELRPGATLFLPIPVDGALLSAGDGHARQGDGEVCGCAIECPSEAQLTLDVRDDLTLDWPLARVDDAWIAFGFHEHLGRAARIAVDGLLDVMEREHGLDRRDALALASVVADLRVTQVVNGTLGVHAVLRDDAFRRVA